VHLLKREKEGQGGWKESRERGGEKGGAQEGASQRKKITFFFLSQNLKRVSEIWSTFRNI
jgi:hypothetical protein